MGHPPALGLCFNLPGESSNPAFHPDAPTETILQAIRPQIQGKAAPRNARESG